MDGSLILPLSQQKIYQVSHLGKATIGYYDGGICVIDNTGKIIASGNYRSYRLEDNRIYLVKSRTEGVWVDLY